MRLSVLLVLLLLLVVLVLVMVPDAEACKSKEKKRPKPCLPKDHIFRQVAVIDPACPPGTVDVDDRCVHCGEKTRRLAISGHVR